MAHVIASETFRHSRGTELLPSAQSDESWTVIVPFKGGATAKSRLAPGLERVAGFRPEVRHRLALAFLHDTFAAAVAVPTVANIIVVSSDPALTTSLPDVILVGDPSKGLNAAIQAGIQQARLLNPDSPVAVLTGDLPCLTPHDLAAALRMARKHELTMAPDRQGSGTTLITALPGVPVAPKFGHHSFEAHTRAGHLVLPLGETSTVRTDVDTLQDLDQALRHGVGTHTLSTVLRLLPRVYDSSSAEENSPPPPTRSRNHSHTAVPNKTVAVAADIVAT